MVSPAGTRGTVTFLVSFVRQVLPPSFMGLVAVTDALNLDIVRSSVLKSQRKGPTVLLLLCSAMSPGQSSGVTVDHFVWLLILLRNSQNSVL